MLGAHITKSATTRTFQNGSISPSVLDFPQIGLPALKAKVVQSQLGFPGEDRDRWTPPILPARFMQQLLAGSR